MAPEIIPLRPGPAATAWLIGRVRTIQADDPLRPITVVVPTHHAGLHLRHRLAGERYANVRFTILPRLAESLGAAHLGAQGLNPLSGVTRAALMRVALAAAGPPLAAGSAHAGLVDLVTRLAGEMRRRADPAGDARLIGRTGVTTSRAAIEAIAAYEQRRASAALYDDVDLLDAAARAVGEGAVAAVLRDLGTIIVHLVPRLGPSDLRLLEQLAEHGPLAVTVAEFGVPPATHPGGTSPVHAAAMVPSGVACSADTVLIASDPVAEVRASVRELLAAAERETPVPLHRSAIVFGDDQTYGTLLRDTLDVAGVPYAALDGRRLSDSIAARGFLGLVRMRDQDFSRSSVLSWLSGLPDRSGVLRSQARWDQLSRDAGVVRGAGQWRDRLTLFARTRERTLARLETDPEDSAGEARRAALRRDIGDAAQIVECIVAVDAATVPPREPSWAAHVAWAIGLRDEFLLPDASWSAEEREASQAVEDVIRGLGAAQAVEPAVSVACFLRAVEDGLRSRRRPEGRLGCGAVIGPHQLLLGMDMARVHVLGAVESSFPSAPPVDPLLPGDPLCLRAARESEERQQWLATLAAAGGGEVVISAPTVDLDGRAVYPSAWLLERLAVGGVRPRASEVRAGTAVDPRLRRVGAAVDAGALATPLSVADRREAEASTGRAAGRRLHGSALAARDDLPLGRALIVARARRSSELSEFDGDLTAVADVASVAGGLCGAPQSATGVETWAVCPFRFLLGRILRVRPTENLEDERWWQIDAAERGTLIHRILERFFSEVATSGRPEPGAPYTDDDARRIEEIADSVFGDAEARGVVGHRLVWANERTAILADLRTILGEDARQRGAGDWRPEHLEQPFGAGWDERSWPALTVPLAGGRSITLRGFIDRVDVDGHGGVRVIDYKTGKSNSKPVIDAGTRFDAGRRLQLPVYGRVVRDHRRSQGQPAPQTTSLYWYATNRGKFVQMALDVDEAVENTLTDVLARIDQGVRAGCFPQVPGDFADWSGRARYDNCYYCDYDTLCPAGRDVLAAAKSASPRMAPYRALRPADVEAGG